MKINNKLFTFAVLLLSPLFLNSQKVKANTQTNNFSKNNIKTSQVNTAINKAKFVNIKSNKSNNEIFAKMRETWKDIIVGNKYYQKNNAQMNNLRAIQDKKVEKIWTSMTKNNKGNLWQAGAELTSSAYLTTSYRNILTMANAYADPASKYYNNSKLLKDTLFAFDSLNENKYNSSIKAYGNWWDWEIGVPQAINNIVITLYPQLSQKEVQTSMASVRHFVPHYTTYRGSVDPSKTIGLTGANQVDICKVKILEGVIENNSEMIKKAVTALETVFPIVKNGEGFYNDGSFIQHTDVGYNGSYGNVLLDGISQLLTVIQNTPYSISKQSLSNVNFWLYKGFIPFVFQGNLMDMVRGRAISRGTFQSNVACDDLARSIIRISSILPKQKQKYYAGIVKYWLSKSNNYQIYLAQVTNYRDLTLIKQIMANSKIKSISLNKPSLMFFPHMDKIIFRNNEKNYAFAINMSSTRTKRYEAMNRENIHGWYTGDGMTYTYTGDLDQFNDGFWATVDPYLLSGTTENDIKQKDGSGSRDARESNVGGSVLDDQGSFIMKFSNNDNNLSANKSWFVDSGNLVALGSNIRSSTASNVQTIVDDRKLADGHKYTLLINGQNVYLSNTFKKSFKNVKTITLNSDKANDKLTYIFIKPQQLTINYISRTGSWRDINAAQSDAKITKKYLQILIPQTNQINDYNYIVAPNNNSMPKNIKIIKNDADSQAISSNNFVGINTFTDNPTNISNIKVAMPLSITEVKRGKRLNFAFANPTWQQNKDIKFHIKDNNYKVVSADKNISYKLSNEYWIISVPAGNYSGKSFHISFANKSNKQI